MKKDHLKLVLTVMVLLGFLLQGCGSVQQLIQGSPTFTPTITLTPSPSPTATSTLTATITPRPTATPNLTATQQYESFFSLIEQYYNAGYLPSINGEYLKLDDFEAELAQVDNYQWWPFDLTPATFVLRAHFKWSSAFENTNLSGCGFVFNGLNEEALAVFLDRRNVVLLSHLGFRVPRSGGSGAVHFKNSDEADFTLIVNSALKKVFVLVNDELNIEYEFPYKESFRGYIGYALISGTYTDYGTRCAITDAKLWTID